MENKTIIIVSVIAVLLIGAVVALGVTNSASITGAATVSCEYSWPQKVIIDGAKYPCSAIRPYCNSATRSCCKYDSSTKIYTDCAPQGPQGQDVLTSMDCRVYHHRPGTGGYDGSSGTCSSLCTNKLQGTSGYKPNCIASLNEDSGYPKLNSCDVSSTEMDCICCSISTSAA